MRKTWSELALALGIMIGVVGGSGLNILGIFWQSHGDAGNAGAQEGDKIWAYAGNAVSIVFAFAALFILFNNTDELGEVRAILAFLIMAGIVLEAFLTLTNTGNRNNDIANYFFIGVDLLIKLIAVMLGYGVIASTSGGRRR